LGTVVARADILQAIAKVPRLPVAGLEALRALQEPDYRVNAVVTAIERDPGLTLNVLRMANSALFGGAHSIGTIKQAVMRLGAQRVGQLITASILGPIARPAVRGYDLPPEALWMHSLAVTIGVEKLAQALNVQPAAYTTTAALLHDVGKILLGTFANIDARPIVDVALAEHIPFDEAERQVLGIDHAEAGAVLMETWQLPRPLCSIVRWHHHPEQCQDETTAVDLVHLADAMSLTSGIGTGCDGLNYTASAAVIKRLGLTHRILERVISEVMLELEKRNPVASDFST
jgi:putative nucleotidyltransferase with HDIG domain